MIGSKYVPLAIKRPLKRLYLSMLGRPSERTLSDALGAMPLMIAAKTYNTEHPRYRPEFARNFPDRPQNGERACDNPLFLEFKKLAKDGTIPAEAWEEVQRAAMAEAAAVPGFEQLMERKAFTEKNMAELTQRYGSHFVAGWVNLADAQFLFWLVRRLKPRTIVQTGVCNGLSSAFMMLALAQNGPEGRLHAIDLPNVFNPNDPQWTRKRAVHGTVIPQGKSSGWLVPDIYRDRCEVQAGDAKALLPGLIDRVDSIDMFYHDSDHTYDHMMFEFAQAKRKLTPNAVVVADDIAWNSSLWDFADGLGVPGWNYRGTMGVAFLCGGR